MKPPRISLLQIAFALLVLTAAAPSAHAAPREELKIGISQFPATLNPNIEAMMAKSYVLAMTRRPFTTYDAGWNLVCMLCTELPTLENGRAVIEDLGDGKKGIRLTYTIRPEARWGDGTEVSTADVLFTYEVGRNGSTGVTSAELYRRITKIDVHDAKSFTLHVDKLTFDYAAINDFQLLPAHVERAAFAEPGQYRNRTRYDTEPTNPGLYFGPYRIVEISSGSHIVLEPNPTWWGEKPAFRRIVVRAIENSAALEANLLSGTVDMIAGELGLTLDQGIAFEKRHGGRFNIVFKPGLVYEHIDLNTEHPILADRRVRQALLWGTDREAISKELFAGRQPVADSFVNPLDWPHATDIPRYRYDPARARQLLDEAGWRELRGGIRHNDKGERLSLELMTTAGNRNRELVQQVLQSQWRQLGIEVRLKNEPPRVFFGETVTRRNFQMAMFAWLSAPENVPRSTLHSQEIPSPANGWSGQNYPGTRNPELDELIDRIELELDRDKRAPMWRRIQEIYATELPALPLYFRADTYVLPKWLKGVEPTGHQYPTTLWVETWRAEE